MPLPSYIGESAAVVTVLHFLLWSFSVMESPLWLLFGLLFIADWMLDGIADAGLCKLSKIIK